MLYSRGAPYAAICPIAAMITGFILDMLFGDPYWFPHIVRWMGSLISLTEKFLRRAVASKTLNRVIPGVNRREFINGTLLVIFVSFVCAAAPFILLFICYRVSPWLGYAVESFLCYQLLAAKSLKTESMKVCDSLRGGDITAARVNLSMIVGRDTAGLDRAGITRAAVETVAENASDGVAAPLFYIMLGGAVFGCLYKAVNTMDSMIGYMNEKYLYFGRAAAKTDDVFNYIPSRVCALLMAACAGLLRYDGKNAMRVWRRDRRKHASPNSAQTEAVCAGALGIRLAGPALYSGVLREKPFIGDDTRPIRDDDIVNANKLMYAASLLMFLAAITVKTVIFLIIP